MSHQRERVNWPVYTITSAAILLGVLAVALGTRVWVLTAIPVGFLFGFFLQKGDLCGASAFSEVLLLGSWKKIWGLWVCIVTAMVGFAVLDAVGWVRLNPKPLVWMNYVLGGAIFGVGMVLAGGCVSGCLFKTGTGNINSMVALLGIPIGVALVEYGPLNHFHAWMMDHTVKTRDGGSVTLVSLTGVPYWVWALALAAITAVAAALASRRRVALVHARAASAVPLGSGATAWRNPLTRSWKPWVAGLAIGLLNVLAYLSSDASGRNYPLGVTHGPLYIELLAFDKNAVPVWCKAPAAAPAASAPAASAAPAAPAAASVVLAAPPVRKYSVWLVALVTSLVVGSWVSGRMSGEARLLQRPPEQTVIAFFGGVLVGIGAGVCQRVRHRQHPVGMGAAERGELAVRRRRGPGQLGDDVSLPHGWNGERLVRQKR